MQAIGNIEYRDKNGEPVENDERIIEFEQADNDTLNMAIPIKNGWLNVSFDVIDLFTVLVRAIKQEDLD